MADQESLISQFAAISGADNERAKFYLESAAWNLESALGSFYEEGEESPTEPLGIRPEAEGAPNTPQQPSAQPTPQARVSLRHSQSTESDDWGGQVSSDPSHQASSGSYRKRFAQPAQDLHRPFTSHIPNCAAVAILEVSFTHHKRNILGKQPLLVPLVSYMEMTFGSAPEALPGSLPYSKKKLTGMLELLQIDIFDEDPGITRADESSKKEALESLRAWVAGFGRNVPSGKPYVLDEKWRDLLYPGARIAAAVPTEVAAPIIEQIRVVTQPLVEETLYVEVSDDVAALDLDLEPMNTEQDQVGGKLVSTPVFLNIKKRLIVLHSLEELQKRQGLPDFGVPVIRQLLCFGTCLLNKTINFRHGAEVVEGHKDGKKSKKFNYSGTGYRLGETNDDTQIIPAAAKEEEEPRDVLLKMWRTGFTVDDGPLRSYEDPSNAEFLNSIRRGEIPLELIREARGGEVYINMADHRHEDYVTPKTTLKPFTGSGHSLGSPAPNVVGQVSHPSGAVGGASKTSAVSGASLDPKAAEKKAQDDLKIDSQQPTTNIQVRLPDGSRLIIKLNHTHAVSDIRQYISTARPSFETTEFALMTTFPHAEVTELSQTVAEAKLLNAALVVKPK
ncbi:uncharacterized protein [Macrobrachium rosenbergii]|uniref:uncharacterized protein n=1 Tax=Macrobrachium rosenbergii TaxID=79674 RepID=UPI0034D68967